MDFTVPADHRIKLKESEKRDKYLNLARELNIKIVVGDSPMTRMNGLTQREY